METIGKAKGRGHLKLTHFLAVFSANPVGTLRGFDLILKITLFYLKKLRSFVTSWFSELAQNLSKSVTLKGGENTAKWVDLR